MSERNLDKAALRGEPSYIWREGQQRRLEMILRAAGERAGGCVLDNGCGVGTYVERLAQLGGEVAGLEFDFERAEEARRRSGGVVNAAGEHLPFPTDRFDLVLSHEVIEHVADDRAAVSEMVRVLRPQGRAVIFCPNRGYPFETHGIYWKGKYHFGNKLFVNYLPSAWRNRLAPHVRAYSQGDLERLFRGLPVKLIERRIIYGAYDNIIARARGLGTALRGSLQFLEKTPLQFFGLSHFWVIEKIQQQQERGAGPMDKFSLKPGHKVSLQDVDTSNTKEFQGGKDAGLAAVQALTHELENLQELLYAEHKHKVLIVLQAMDTGGKDGTIRRVFEGVNPQGVRVASFKVPTALEADHDYLWRIHQQMPARGEIVIFNRSHYEDVLVVRVHELVPAEVWGRRYDQINEFERMLSQEGTLILKFFLHISLDEQKRRFRDRLLDETKQWKYNPGDLQERALWPKYMKAYEDLLEKTTTAEAAWQIIPADHKWYRDWVVANIIVDALRDLKMKYPRPTFDVAASLREFDKLG